MRPHLAVLLSFSKIFLKGIILENREFLQSEMAHNFLFRYFPKSFDTLYSDEVASHPLKYEIIATMIANKIINASGSSFIHDYSTLGHERFMVKIKSFLVLNSIISANDLRHEIYREDYSLTTKKQYELILNLESTLEFLVTWVLTHGEDEILIFDKEHEYKVATLKFLENDDQEGKKICQNQHINRFFSKIDYIRMLTTIIKVKEDTKQEFLDVANLFLSTTQDLNILELNGFIKDLEANSQWDERLKEQLLLDTLEIISKTIDKIMHFKRSNENIEDAFSAFFEINKSKYDA
ncbi:MAG: NAD-glutamate dehydrogenase, partial [Campylobacterales bacterium]|nr:NAD-glutamate dehydrogenase [Campylobacterales bacterium]